ncbi:MAG TPA: hybrid sensor histidine kinase/response regulator [Bacteroidales bacterium]|nr:hybrid sensor histidine kinase/response regulator [Bacteroidales bacterium]
MYAINELEKAIVTNCDYLVEYRFQKKDGTYIFIEERAIVLPGMQKMYGTMNNISERKKNQAILYENEKRLKEQNEEYLTLNEELVERNIRVAEMYDELLRAKEKAEENDRLKSAFLANISHEIRTPMNGLVGFSELIIQPDLDDESKKSYAEIINKSCNQLLSIINDVIDISKIETNQVTTNETNVLLNHLLSNIYQFFLPTAKSNNIQLVFANKDINDDIAILVDEVKLTQIMNNLVNNAIKFTSSGKIEFGYDINSEFLEFFVKDTGIGIEAKDYELIFDRFRQVDLGMARNYGGTGLGLSISKAFVEKMGGRIWLDSKVSEGTTFYFTIPYKPIINKEKKKLTINEKQLAIHDTNILVAEDEDINFMYVKVLLDSLGFKVVRAENGKRAVDIFTNNPKFDIILMDIKMPIMGGIEATKIIKSINASVPIIATTAYALSEEKDKFLAAGCDDYISKPLRPNDLMSVINKFINK